MANLFAAMLSIIFIFSLCLFLKESLSPPTSASRLSTMAPKREKLTKAQDDSWTKEVAMRLERGRRLLEEGHTGQNVSEEAWQRVASESQWALREGKQPGTDMRVSPLSGVETAEMVYRSTGEGLQLSKWNPWQNSGMVEGRPVQVQIHESHNRHSAVSFLYMVFVFLTIAHGLQIALESLSPRESSTVTPVQKNHALHALLMCVAGADLNSRDGR